MLYTIKLKQLLKDLPQAVVKGSREVDITGLCSNSKFVSPGNLFVAKKGYKSDGNQYIQEAIDGGAVAVLTDMYNPFLTGITQVILANVTEVEGHLSDLFYRSPSKELLLVGVTGTAGKTTTSYVIRHLLEKLRVPCGLLGTIEYIVQDHRYPAPLTTPDILTTQRLLRDMVQHGCGAAVMEVSSHALDQRRVDPLLFDIGVFTNLSAEHLDYHKTMDHYAASKAKLFSLIDPEKKKERPKGAIVNADDPYAERIAKNARVPKITYGLENEADVKASDVRLSPQGTEFTVSFGSEAASFSWPLIGLHNISNCLAAVAVGLLLNHELKELSACLIDFQAPEGRLERVENAADLNIFVDYAHKADALEKVLRSLKEVQTKGRIITVFGCGGNRDAQKRPHMAAVAELYSDFTIVTNDNPREEDPQRICADIVQGFKKAGSHAVELDRKKAIAQAIDLAGKEDLILIAGKGHETYQILGPSTIHFDDREIAAQICQRKFQTT